MSRTQFLVLLSLLALAGVGGWVLDRTTSSSKPGVGVEFRPQIASTDVDLTAFESTAADSCKCRMRGGNEDSCDRQLDQSIENIRALIVGDQQGVEPAAGVGTACAPVSTESVCFEFSDSERCFVLGYNIVVAHNPDGGQAVVCTEADAQAIERAYTEAWAVDGKQPSTDNPMEMDAADDRAKEAVARTLERIQRGESFAYDLENRGCV